MSGREGETAARRAIEDHGFTVHDANILFYANCRNIDLVVFGKTKAVYVQVKSSTRPSSKNSVVVEGSTWTDDQLNGAPIYNKHDENLEAALIVIVDEQENGTTNFYIAPPKALEDTVRESGRAWAKHPKRDGTARSLGFRKELSREQLKDWLEAWHLLDSLLKVSN